MEGTHLLLVPARNGAEDICLFLVVVEHGQPRVVAAELAQNLTSE